MAHDSVPTYDNCHKVTDFCKASATAYGGYLWLAPNAIFGIIFGVLFLVGVFFGFRGRTWSYMIWLAIGTAFEFFGYCGRVILAKNPWVKNAFLVQFVTLLLAPTLIAAAAAITFKHLVLWYGPKWSFIKPKLYPIVFVGTDFISIFVQIIGGGITASNTSSTKVDKTKQKLAEVLLIGGVSFQVANMVACASLMLIYAWRRKKDTKGVGFAPIEGESPLMGGGPSRATATAEEAKRARLFCYLLGVAYLLIIIRCGYRVFESIPHFQAKIFDNQGLFLAMDSVMMVLSIGILTIFHPQRYFPFLNLKHSPTVVQGKQNFHASEPYNNNYAMGQMNQQQHRPPQPPYDTNYNSSYSSNIPYENRTTAPGYL